MIYFIYLSRLRRGAIIKETATNVWFQEEGYRVERILKRGSNFKSFGTFEEAKAEQIKRMEAIIARQETELQSKRDDLTELKNRTQF